MFQVPVKQDFSILVFDDDRRDFAVFVDVLADLTVHDTPGVSPRMKRIEQGAAGQPAISFSIS
jgi:hypothetical protein